MFHWPITTRHVLVGALAGRCPVRSPPWRPNRAEASMRITGKAVLRALVSVALVAIGVAHFADPAPFVRIMPQALPAHVELVYISGFFEILGGIGLLVPRTRRWGSWGLIALFIAVFPANVNMAVNQIQIDPAAPIPVWAMWARLPMQAAIIGLVWWLGRPDGQVDDTPV